MNVRLPKALAPGFCLAALIATPAQAARPPGLASQASTASAPAAPRVVYDAYILGPGDTLAIELLDIPELSGIFSIGPDGTLYLPRLRSLFVEGLTVEELRYFLTDQFKAYVKQPQVYVKPVAYRPVRIYVGGEITRPGFYTLSGPQRVPDPIERFTGEGLPQASQSLGQQPLPSRSFTDDVAVLPGVTQAAARWPTVFDALRAAQGVTPYSNLTAVEVIRRQPLSAGGGKIRAQVDFLKLVTEGDERANLRLFDGDVVTVARSPQVMRDQLLAASRTNLSPDYLQVFVSGRVKQPGAQVIPQGSTLNQAIASAGGVKLLRGQVEFLRFSNDGATDRRLFSFNAGAKAGDYKNPVLMTGDVIRVNDSVLSASVEVLNEITGPAVGIYSVYSLFRP